MALACLIDVGIPIETAGGKGSRPIVFWIDLIHFICSNGGLDMILSRMANKTSASGIVAEQVMSVVFCLPFGKVHRCLHEVYYVDRYSIQ